MENFIQKIEFEIKKDSNEEYHSRKEFIGASGIKLLKESPLHFKEAEQPSSEALEFGYAYHSFILEPELFKEEYYIFNDSNICEKLIGEGAKSPRATKAYKEWFENEMRIAGDMKTIDDTTMKKMEAMKSRLFSHYYAKSLLTNGEPEISIYTEITIFTGQKIKVKIRPDNLKRQKRLIADLKTTQSASVNEFPNHAAKLNYHIQAALYSDIMEAVTGDGLGYHFFFVAQEKTTPYAFNIFEASPQFISQGRYEYEQLLMLYAYCLENDIWPGYQIFTQNKYGVNELNIPAYLIKEINWFDHKNNK